MVVAVVVIIQTLVEMVVLVVVHQVFNPVVLVLMDSGPRPLHPLSIQHYNLFTHIL
jgi:hypothetical protein|tara:strand:+ start:130 stop:297 length:168 start_codon:yes stop_codon:yes gene_type:complete